MIQDVDTIVAIATPPGRGGVGIVRLSGPKAYSIALSISKKNNILPRRAIFSDFFDQDNGVIDQGILLYFNSPHSFTGEDVVELQGHGSPIVMEQLVALSVIYGARLARAGEFSERAFLNDKIDLAQAEAIADLIDAGSITAARMAIRSLQGRFSDEIHALHEAMIQLRLYVEAAIDFPDEEIDFLGDGIILNRLNQLIDSLKHIQKQARQGLLMRDGLRLVIAGRPNAGKSTLINALAGQDLAIVTDIPGTTRDVMRAEIYLDDVPVHVIDTAGIRESDDLVEKEGIRRAWNEINQADMILLLHDLSATDDTNQLLNDIQSKLKSPIPVINVYNKADCVDNKTSSNNHLKISAKNGQGIDTLIKHILQLKGHQPEESAFIARQRHLDALSQSLDYLLHGLNQLEVHRAGELLAEDLRLAHQTLGEITGVFRADDLLGRIFSSFCIGK